MKREDHPVQGTRREHPVNLHLGFAGDEFGYLIDMGLPRPGSSAFSLDPEIKHECIWHGPVLRPSTMLVDRQGPLVRIRGEGEDWSLVTEQMSAFDSMMTHVADPRNAPEMLALRESISRLAFLRSLQDGCGMHQHVCHRSARTLLCLVMTGRTSQPPVQTIYEIGGQ